MQTLKNVTKWLFSSKIGWFFLTVLTVGIIFSAAMYDGTEPPPPTVVTAPITATSPPSVGTSIAPVVIAKATPTIPAVAKVAAKEPRFTIANLRDPLIVIGGIFFILLGSALMLKTKEYKWMILLVPLSIGLYFTAIKTELASWSISGVGYPEISLQNPWIATIIFLVIGIILLLLTKNRVWLWLLAPLAIALYFTPVKQEVVSWGWFDSSESSSQVARRTVPEIKRVRLSGEFLEVNIPSGKCVTADPFHLIESRQINQTLSIIRSKDGSPINITLITRPVGTCSKGRA